MLKIGVLPFARPTFDVELAEAKLAAMLSVLEGDGRQVVGPRSLLMGSEDGEAAIAELQQGDIDRLLVLQVSFTDASLIVAAALAIEAPLAIWAIPEPRIGGRLRLNSFCGLNLASHALGLREQEFSWFYCDPERVSGNDIDGLLDGSKRVHALLASFDENEPDKRAIEVAQGLKGKRIGRIGAHPEGFDTCAYDAFKLEKLTGVSVEALELETLFTQAAQAPDELVVSVRSQASAVLPDLDEVDQGELDKSLRLKVALDGIREAGNYQAFALRCWPETFTEYGGAVCGPVSMLGENKIPCACEADVYGALTQLILQEVSQSAVFLTDLVDMDCDDNTGVVWHCGQAPISMRDEGVEASATIHTNRKMPLLYEFPLKAGRVTLMRFSQGRGETKMVLSGGEMLQRPMAFTGTSGVLRFDRPVDQVLPDMINSGLEHHMALAYGDHREMLRGVAAALQLPVLEI
ncbi:MAG: L-fucose/L-arabinose isomerase family protein [Rhizobiaceae bacterium]